MTFRGIIDLVEMKADVYYDDLGKDMRVEAIPDDMMDLANEYREKLMDAVSMFDDEIMEMYLDGEEIPQDKIRAAIRKATIANRDGACGLRYLLPATRASRSCWMPSWTICPLPLDIPAIKGVNPKTDEEEDASPPTIMRPSPPWRSRS